MVYIGYRGAREAAVFIEQMDHIKAVASILALPAGQKERGCILICIGVAVFKSCNAVDSIKTSLHVRGVLQHSAYQLVLLCKCFGTGLVEEDLAYKAAVLGQHTNVTFNEQPKESQRDKR